MINFEVLQECRKVYFTCFLEKIYFLSKADRILPVNLAQGFIPAILTREILLRRSPLQPGKWLSFLTICVCMTISVFYELIEW